MYSRINLKLFCALGLAGSLCACVIPPKDKTVNFEWPVSGGYVSAQHENISEKRDASLVPWQEYFNDSVLQRLISQALENNRDIRSMALRVDQMKALHSIQVAKSFPEVSAFAGGGRGALNPNIPADTSYIVGAGIVSWELDFWGRVSSLREAALEGYLASHANLKAAQLGLISQITNSYLLLGELDQRAKVVKLVRENRTKSLQLSRREFELGKIAQINLTTSQLLMNQADTQSSEIDQARDLQLQNLTFLVGGDISWLREGRLPAADAIPLMVPGLPSDLLISRPDIIAAESQLKAAKANVSAARAAFFPVFTLTGGGGSISPSFNNLFDGATKAWLFFPSVTLPIFDAGLRHSNLTLNELRNDEAVSNYERSIQIAFRDVNEALINANALKRQFELSKSNFQFETVRSQLVGQRFKSGAANYLEVLDADQALLFAEQALLGSQRRLLSSHVSLYLALGGGSKAPIPGNEAN